jgi:hypothetical protein
MPFGTKYHPMVELEQTAINHNPKMRTLTRHNIPMHVKIYRHGNDNNAYTKLQKY